MGDLSKPASDKSSFRNEQISLEQRVKISEKLLEKVNDIVYRYQVFPEQQFTYVSQACIKLTGYIPEEHYADKQLVYKIIHPDDKPLLEAAIHNKDKTNQKLMLRWYKKDGTLVWTEHWIDYEFDNNGRLAALNGIARDITDQKLYEERSKHNEDRFKKIFNDVFEGLIVFDKKTKILEVNLEFEKITGLKRNEVMGHYGINLARKFAENPSLPTVLKIIKIILSGKSVKKIIIPFNEKTLEITTSVRKQDSYHIAVIRDITSEKDAEEKLAETQNKYRNIIKTTPEGFWLINAEGITLEVNDSLCNMLGYSRKEFIGKSPLIFFDKNNQEILKQQMAKIYTTTHRSFEVTALHKNGYNVHLSSNATLLKDNQGNLTGSFAMVRDITDIKQKEEELRESERNLKLAQKIAAIGNWALSPGDKKPYWSAEIFKFFELDPAKGPLTLEQHKRALSEKSYKTLRQSLEFAVKEGKPYDIELFLELPSGNNKWVRSICQPEEQGGSDGFKLHGTIQDITEQKIARQNLIEAKEKAEESDKLKSAFLANMSHEIRTPMNGVLGFADMLKDPDLTGEDQTHYIDIIERSGMRMLHTVNDLIEISKIETKQVSVNYKQINFNELVRSLYTFFEPEAERKGLELNLHSSLEDDEADITSDPIKLDSIITNFIKNAIKYTPSGKIDIGYQKKGNNIEFYVRDTGIGIPKHRQKAIFNRFEQADITDKRAFEGSGLGLAITKSYVEMLGGTIRLDSEQDKGSCFYFTLPINTFKAKELTQKSKQENNTGFSSENKLITLIADDEETSALYLHKLLKNRSSQIYHAQDGKKAIETLKKHPEINLVLMDIKMPLLDGYETTKIIRKFNTDTKVIAQTAYALEGDKEKALSAGCDDYLAKPIRKENLYKLISKLFNH